MRNSKAKEIRKIIPPTNEIGRRNYRRAKKAYAKLSTPAKPLFLKSLKQILQSD
jgi:hypothetical protein